MAEVSEKVETARELFQEGWEFNDVVTELEAQYLGTGHKEARRRAIDALENINTDYNIMREWLEKYSKALDRLQNMEERQELLNQLHEKIGTEGDENE